MKLLLKRIKENAVSICYLLEWFILRIIKRDFSYGRKKTDMSKAVRILGNGPSLKNVLYQKDSSDIYDYCCVNFSPLSDSFFEIKPKYLVFVDPLFFKYENDKFKEWKDKILLIDWSFTIVVPFYAKSRIEKVFRNNKYIKVKSYPGGLRLDMKIKSLRFFIYKNGIAGPPAQNVVIAAIYKMILEGYKVIELYGVEHSWLQQIKVNEKSELCLQDVHFYDKEKTAYVPWKINGNQLLIHELLEYLSITFAGYHDLKSYAKSLGDVKIYNCTPDSFIDAFEKKYDK